MRIDLPFLTSFAAELKIFCRDVVQGAQLVVWTPFGFVALFIGKGAAHRQSTQEGACQESGSNFFDLHELTPLMGPLDG
jgi:hypothetical protein